jgi:NADH-quinone oxidoreductase subunit D
MAPFSRCAREMVRKMLEDIKAELTDISVSEVSYPEKGYHLSIDVPGSDLLRVIRFFDTKGLYLEDLCCVDYVEYLELVYLFNSHTGLFRIKTTVKLTPEGPSAPTISDIYTIAHWYEREIHEFFGVYFEGHPNMSYLFLHDGIDSYPLRKNKIPISEADKNLLSFHVPHEEEDTFSVNLGPQHPSTHGVLRVVIRMDGEYILSADPVLGYLHRMHEKMAENRSYNQFLPNPARMDYLGALNFNLAHVAAVERLCGISVPERAQYVRTISCELNRIASHIFWMGAFLGDLGGLTPFLYGFDDRENILDILEAITGSRLTYCYFRFGGLFNDVDEGFIDATRAFVKRMWKRLPMYENLVTKNVIFINRVKGVGVLDRDYIRRIGCSGPVIRGSGIPFDMRKIEPYAAYGDLTFEVVTGGHSDNMDRYMVRMREIETSLNIISAALDRMPTGPFMTEKVPKKMKPPKGDCYHTVESPRGQLGVYIVSDGSDTPYRMRWRVPSYSNLMTFPHLSQGTLIADAIATLGSLDLIIPEIDR